MQALFGLYLLTLKEPALSNFWVKHVPSVYNYYSSFRFYPKYKFDLDDAILTMASFIFTILGFRFKNIGTYQRILFLNLIIASMNYFLQSKFFLYQIITIELILFLISFQFQHLRFLGNKTSCVLFCLLLVWQTSYYKKICVFYDFNDMGKYGEGRYTHLVNFLKSHTSSEDYVYPLSSSVWVDYPTLNILRLNNSSRYLFQYPMSFFGSVRYTNKVFIENLANPQIVSDEDQYFNQVKQDIIKYKPKIIFYLENKKYRQNLPEGFPVGKYLEFKGILPFIKEQSYVLKERTPDGFYFYMKE